MRVCMCVGVHMCVRAEDIQAPILMQKSEMMPGVLLYYPLPYSLGKDKNTSH